MASESKSQKKKRLAREHNQKQIDDKIAWEKYMEDLESRPKKFNPWLPFMATMLAESGLIKEKKNGRKKKSERLD